MLSNSSTFPQRKDKLQRPDLLDGRNPRTINMSTIGHALAHTGDKVFGPRIEALLVYNSNPVAVAPDSASVVRGFAREDLFTVVLEHFRTDTADYADFILPATTQLEHWDIHQTYGHTDVMLNRPAIAPLGQARSNTQIFRDLALRMGYTDPCFGENDETLCRQAFGDAVNFELLLQQGFAPLDLADAPFANGGFATPSGKCEFFSQRLADAGQDGLPDFLPNYEPAGADARYPLAMISPPARNFLNSSFVNVASLQAAEREPLRGWSLAILSALEPAPGAAVLLEVPLAENGRPHAWRAFTRAGDDAWSVGCRAYSFSRHQLRRAAESGRYNWLGVLDGTQHFVFLIEGVPVRFFRGDAEDPTKRTLRQQEVEAEQLALAFGRGDGAEGLMFRLAVETDERGAVSRVVFLALRGEEGRVECFWPVPLGDAPPPHRPPPPPVMKLITAIIRPERLPEVKAALFRVGVTGVTLSRVAGHGGERETIQRYRAETVVLEFHEKVLVEMACSEPFVEPTIQAILSAARTGNVGESDARPPRSGRRAGRPAAAVPRSRRRRRPC